jgi:2-keto-4-pentenoate hydratase/2-oxohepta-3-ene-1,7-dioic acid hydratase in catechol pathway
LVDQQLGSAATDADGGGVSVTAARFGLAGILDGHRHIPAVMRDNAVLPVHVLIPGAPDFEGLLGQWDAWIDRIAGALKNAREVDWRPASEVVFTAPGARRPAIYCAGANYRDHLAEMSDKPPATIFHFVSPPRTLNGHRRIVSRPANVELLDWEAELTVVIGRTARNVSADDALKYIAGFTIANDVSARGDRMRHPIFGIDWMWSKNGEGLTPVGPAIVPARFVPDAGSLGISLSVNGELRQSSNTSELITDIATQIAVLSGLVTLDPGDLILTGTPAGTGKAHGVYLSDGDVMAVRIDLLGELVNTVGAARDSVSKPGERSM